MIIYQGHLFPLKGDLWLGCFKKSHWFGAEPIDRGTPGPRSCCDWELVACVELEPSGLSQPVTIILIQLTSNYLVFFQQLSSTSGQPHFLKFWQLKVRPGWFDPVGSFPRGFGVAASATTTWAFAARTSSRTESSPEFGPATDFGGTPTWNTGKLEKLGEESGL